MCLLLHLKEVIRKSVTLQLKTCKNIDPKKMWTILQGFGRKSTSDSGSIDTCTKSCTKTFTTKQKTWHLQVFAIFAQMLGLNVDSVILSQWIHNKELCVATELFHTFDVFCHLRLKFDLDRLICIQFLWLNYRCWFRQIHENAFSLHSKPGVHIFFFS